MPATPYNFLAQFQAKPGRAEDLRRVLSAEVAPTRAEPGCINYDLHVNMDDFARFVLYEGWESKEALDHHMTLPHFTKLMAELDDIAEKGPDGKPFQGQALSMLTEVA